MAEYIQGAELVNQMAQEALGETAVLEEDWSNINTIGTKIFSSTNNVESASKVLIDRIGETIKANDRAYTPDGPDLKKSNREYASATQKIRLRYPEADDNQSRMLNDGQVYEMDQYHAPDLVQHFWDQRITFALEKPSLPWVQFKDAFLNRAAWESFEAMYRKAWVDQETFFTERLTKSLLANRIAYNVAAAYAGADYTGPGGPMVVNIRALYNARFGQNLTPEQCFEDGDFIRYAFFTIDRYARKMKNRTSIFNPEGEVNWTPAEYRRAVFLDDFLAAANYYLYNGANQMLVDRFGLPEYSGISAWQGIGQDASPMAASTVSQKIKLANGTTRTITIQGVIGLVYDWEALMITPFELRGYTHFNKSGEFINPFYKREMGFLNAQDENAIVFTIA